VDSRLGRCTRLAGDKRSGTVDAAQETNVQRRGVGRRARILTHHRRRHGRLLGGGGKQRERRQLPLVGVFRALEKGDMGRGEPSRR
jgi:hypothetical protein